MLGGSRGFVFVAVAPMFMLLACGGGGFDYDEWDSWNSFPEGAWVTFKMSSPVEQSSTKKLVKKEADRLTLEAVRDSSFGGKTTRTGTLTRTPKKKAVVNETCDSCGKKYDWPAEEWTTDFLEVGGVKLETTVGTSYGALCMEEEHVFLATKTWYSRKVPGWIVRTEGAGMKRRCVDYGPK